MLADQSETLFNSLNSKQMQLEVIRHQLWKGIHRGGGATTAFKELETLIQGLKLLITSRAPTFGVKIQLKTAPPRIAPAFVSSFQTFLEEPQGTIDEVIIAAAIKGILPVPVYDVEFLYNLMEWKEGFKNLISPAGLKDKVVMFRFGVTQKKDMTDLVKELDDVGWSTSYKAKPKCRTVVFVWKSLIAKFEKEANSHVGEGSEKNIKDSIPLSDASDNEESHSDDSLDLLASRELKASKAQKQDGNENLLHQQQQRSIKSPTLFAISDVLKSPSGPSLNVPVPMELETNAKQGQAGNENQPQLQPSGGKTKSRKRKSGKTAHPASGDETEDAPNRNTRSRKQPSAAAAAAATPEQKKQKKGVASSPSE